MTTASASAGAPGRARNPSLALLSLSLGYFAMGTASLAVIGLSVPMGKDLGVPAARIGLLVTVFALTFAIAAPLAPILLNRLDRKWTMVLGLSALAAGALICAVAPNYGLVTVGRVIAALGAAVFAPLASAAGSILVTEERRQRALATVFAGMTIAAVLGVPLVTFISDALNWRPALLGVGVLCVLALVAVWVLVPRLSAGERPSMAAYRGVLHTPGALSMVVTTLLFMAAQFVVYAIAGVYLTDRFGATPSLISITLFAFGIIGVLGNATAGRVGDRVGGTRLVTVAIAGLGIAYLLLLVVPGVIGAGMAVFAFWAFFSQLYQAPQQSRLVTLLPDQRALILALNAAALYLGMSLGSLLGSEFLAKIGATALPAIGLGLVVLGGAAHVASTRRAERLATARVETA